MQKNPRNEETTTLDLVLLFGMPAAIAALLVVIAYLGLTSASAIGH